MQIYDEYTIDNFLSSNKTYEKKVETLRGQQEHARKMDAIIDEKIEKLENGDYLQPMLEERIRNLRTLRNWLVSASVTGLFSGVEIANFQKIEQLINNSDTANKGMALLFAGIVSSAICVTSIGGSIKSSYNEMLYKQRISSYQRRLK